ncbi:MAG: tetratricopeptide repeat protein [bacterium]
MKQVRAVPLGVCIATAFLLIGCTSAPKTVRDYNTAVRLIAEQRFGPAEEILWDLVRYCPDDHEAWNQLGLIAFRDRRWGEAERCFRRSAELAPTRLIYRRNLALSLAEQNRLLDAEGILQQLTEADPKSAVYRTDRARVLWLLDKRDCARAELSKARELAPEDRTIQLLTHTWSLSPQSSK